MIIYKLTSPSGKSYIGQHKNSDPHVRFRQHVTSYRKWVKDGRPRKSYNTILFYAFDKYPPEQWTVETIATCETVEELNFAEKKLIAEHKSIDPDYGYNLLPGGGGHSVETFSDMHRQNISEGRKQFFQSEDGEAWRQELSKKFSGNNNPGHVYNKGKPAWNRGLSPSEETKLKMSVASREYWDSPEGKEHAKRNVERMVAGRKAKKGRPRTANEKEADKIRGLSRRGIPTSQKQKETTRLRAQKTYLVTDPDGKTQIVTNLRQFAADYTLNDSNMRSPSGSKGWRAKLID